MTDGSISGFFAQLSGYELIALLSFVPFMLAFFAWVIYLYFSR